MCRSNEYYLKHFSVVCSVQYAKYIPAFFPQYINPLNVL